VDVGDRSVFTRLVRGAFQQRRKMILNALGPPAATLGRDAADLLARAGVDPTIRPGDLTLEAFAALSRAVL
jgi:16S rRNA (adenine1518-N6/adenine1519-N6)-dimethyltransferase